MEYKKIGIILFHVFAFLITVIAFGLVMESINSITDTHGGLFKQDSDLVLAQIFVILSYVLGTISIIIFILEWRRIGKIELYLVAFFIGQLLILTGNALIIIL